MQEFELGFREITQKQNENYYFFYLFVSAPIIGIILVMLWHWQILVFIIFF